MRRGCGRPRPCVRWAEILPLDTGTLLFGAVLVGLAATVGGAMLVAGVSGRRRQTASLLAIEFVRSTFAGRLARGEPLSELLSQLVEALTDSLHLDAAEVWLHVAGALERTVSEPRQPGVRIEVSGPEQSVVANAQVSGPAWAQTWMPALLAGRPVEAQVRIAPISHSGDLLGLILVERRRHPERLAAEADLVLGELAREVAVGVNKARLDAALEASVEQLRQQALQLQASRARVVSAADAERQRIERDLHDGAQQYLVAMAVKLRLAKQLAAQDTDQAQRMLDQLAGDLNHAIEELRNLAHGIYPPLLSTRGLGEALGAACRRGPLPADLRVDGIARYPAEVEAAVYFCCVEALQNAGKHAGAGSHVQVRLRQEDGSLTFDVSDDGRGFVAASPGAGAGLTNMADRLGAVGGQLEVASTPGGGSVIRGVVPVSQIR